MFERFSLEALKAAGRQHVTVADLVVVAVGSLSAVLEFVPSRPADVPKNASQFGYALKPETVPTAACFVLAILYRSVIYSCCSLTPAPSKHTHQRPAALDDG